MTDKRVGVLMGGLSSEREVSLGTGRGVLAALEGLGYDCVGVDWTEGSSITKLLEAAGVEVVWNALHGTYGEDGAIQGLLKCIGIPFTGAGLLACAMAMDKVVAKQIFRHRGVPTPPGVAARTYEEAREVGTPCVVKPASEGSSVGVTIVNEASELEKAFELAKKFDGAVLVEEFIAGPELHVGILGEDVLGSVEVRPAAEFYDYEAKYKRSDTQYITPPEVSPHALEAAEAAALAAYLSLGCESYGRVDVRLAGGSHPMVLEVNCLPGMTETSLLPKIAAAAGIDYATLCERILADAI